MPMSCTHLVATLIQDAAQLEAERLSEDDARRAALEHVAATEALKKVEIGHPRLVILRKYKDTDPQRVYHVMTVRRYKAFKDRDLLRFTKFDSDKILAWPRNTMLWP